MRLMHRAFVPAVFLGGALLVLVLASRVRLFSAPLLAKHVGDVLAGWTAHAWSTVVQPATLSMVVLGIVALVALGSVLAAMWRSRDAERDTFDIR